MSAKSDDFGVDNAGYSIIGWHRDMVTCGVCVNCQTLLIKSSDFHSIYGYDGFLCSECWNSAITEDDLQETKRNRPVMADGSQLPVIEIKAF